MGFQTSFGRIALLDCLICVLDCGCCVLVAVADTKFDLGFQTVFTRNELSREKYTLSDVIRDKCRPF